MKNPPDKTAQWLNDVASGKLSMSQRKVSVLVKSDGDLHKAVALAKSLGVHLIRLTDDEDNDLIAASLNKFEVLC